MAFKNPYRFLQQLERKPQTIPADLIRHHMTEDDRKLLQSIGLTSGELFEKITADFNISYDRLKIYNEVAKAINHWMVGPALELYADYATSYSAIHGATIWITSENPKYQRILTDLLNNIGIEEKIFDWAWTTGSYGDHFVRIHGMPEIGVISVDDDDHPMNFGRIDHNGCLIGYYETQYGQHVKARTQTIIPPWEVVHFRLLGAKRKRAQFGDPTYTEFRSSYLMGGHDRTQVSSKYGTCVPWHTPIETDQGVLSIYDIVKDKLPVKVKSYNETTHKFEFKPVVNWFRRLNHEDLVKIKFNANQTSNQVLCTPDHLVLTDRRGWVRSQDLTLNDSVMVAENIEQSTEFMAIPSQITELSIESTKYAGGIESEVFDIEVEDNHNFLVNGAIIHNSLLINSFLAYQRLRLAEDSLLMARLTRGIIRYVWKLRVDGCVSPDTRIELMDGTNPTIEEMWKNRDKYLGKGILSIDEKDNSLKVGYIGDIKKTRPNAQLVRVWVDNGKYIDCTPDHKFMNRDGSYTEAKDLKPGDSLMPYYEGLSRNGIHGYKMVYDPKTNRKKMLHRLPFGRIKRGLIVHHRDFNKLNNDPDNLVVMTNEDHVKFHHEHSTNYGWAYSTAKTPRTQEHINKIIESKRVNGTIKLSKDTKLKIGRAIKRLHGLGKYKPRPQSEYSKLKNRLAHNPGAPGRPHTKEEIEKMSKANRRVRSFVTRSCKCGCGEQFRYVITPEYVNKQKYVGSHNTIGDNNPSHLKKVGKQTVLNHKVARVEWLTERRDTYDLTISGSSPNFPTSAGVFIHNSNAESVNELMTQLVGMLKKARALSTSPAGPNFDSKFGPLASVEDLLIPVWGDVGDLTYDKIGGDADIRWIVDVEELRNQLSCTLRVPLSVLGGYIQEASGELGSQAISELSLEFAHTAGRLKRAMKAGVKRICQIHLAYLNMDPDPRLFDVNMSESSTAEEKNIRESLNEGVDVIDRMIEIAERAIGEGETDFVSLVNYLNQKILKLDDFNLEDYRVSKALVSERESVQPRPIELIRVNDMDLLSFLPTTNHMVEIMESRGSNTWDDSYREVTITRTEKDVFEIRIPGPAEAPKLINESEEVIHEPATR